MGLKLCETWASAGIFPVAGGNLGTSLILFRLLTMYCKWTFVKRFIDFLHHKQGCELSDFEFITVAVGREPSAPSACTLLRVLLEKRRNLTRYDNRSDV